MYSKGEQRRDAILENAKAVLYEKGFKGTTIREIAQRADIPVSVFHYYFPKKEDVIRQVYYDVQGDIDLFVYSSIADADSNTFLAYAVAQRIYFDMILNDPNNTRFYRECLETSSNAQYIRPYATNAYRKFLDEFGVKISDEVLQIYVLMDFGARREVFAEYFSGKLELQVQELAELCVGIFPKMLMLEADYIMGVLKESEQIYQSLDFGHIKFLK